MAGKSSFKVIIVGGGIAGLSLANALQIGGIDFVLLEWRSIIDPQVGASIGILPNGSRILDQLECYEEIIDLVEPIVRGASHKADGSLIGEASDSAILGNKRSGYSACFLDRQWVLRILAEHIQNQKKIQLNKKVVRVEQTAESATVYCADGSSFEGDVVVGADGVFSAVRHEMWRQAEEAGEGGRFAHDKEALFAEYQCLFGISARVDGESHKIDGMMIGTNDITFDKDRSTLTVTGKNGRVFWFIFGKMDKIYKPPNIPKYSADDQARFLEKHGDLVIMDKPRITVNDFNDPRVLVSSTLVALEEAEYENWAYGRMVCIGDSIHKMTPNLGAGGNSAIESAAMIANQLKRLADRCGSSKPGLSHIRQALDSFVKERHIRITSTMKLANGVTRLQALKGPVEKFVAYHVIPNAGDYMGDLYGDFQIGAPMLDYLPPPPRSLKATMPFNPEQGWGFQESKARRALTALPILGLAIAFLTVTMTSNLWGHLEGILDSKKLTYDGKSYPTIDKFYPFAFLDNICRLVEAFCMPASLGLDPVSHAQTFTFLVDISTIYATWLIESTRRSNLFTLPQLPLLFGFLMQQLGFGIVAPLYFFLLYTFSPISVFRASDHRLTNVAYTYSIFPVVFLFAIMPVYLAFQSPNLQTRQYWMFAWQLFPLWISIAQYALAKTVMPNTHQQDRIYKPFVDVPAVRLTVGAFGAISAAAWICTRVTSPFLLSELFLPTLKPEDNFFALTRFFWQVDELVAFGACFLWLAYTFGDLKAAGMVKQSWALLLVLLAAATLCVGPGTSFALGFLWREQIIITKRHKGAVTEGWEAKKQNGKITNGYNNGHANGHANGKIH